MCEAGCYLSLGGTIGPQPVGHHDARTAPAFEKLAQKVQSSRLVARELDKDVEHIAIRINRAPQPVGSPLMGTTTSSRCHRQLARDDPV